MLNQRGRAIGRTRYFVEALCSNFFVETEIKRACVEGIIGDQALQADELARTGLDGIDAASVSNAKSGQRRVIADVGAYV